MSTRPRRAPTCYGCRSWRAAGSVPCRSWCRWPKAGGPASGQDSSSVVRLPASIVGASNGQHALRRVARAVPWLVLLDLTTPVMHGLTFLHALREQPGCADVPVAVLTARDLTNEERRRLNGANQVLNKGDTSLCDLADRLHALVRAAVEPVGSPA